MKKITIRRRPVMVDKQRPWVVIFRCCRRKPLRVNNFQYALEVAYNHISIYHRTVA